MQMAFLIVSDAENDNNTAQKRGDKTDEADSLC